MKTDYFNRESLEADMAASQATLASYKTALEDPQYSGHAQTIETLIRETEAQISVIEWHLNKATPANQ